MTSDCDRDVGIDSTFQVAANATRTRLGVPSLMFLMVTVFAGVGTAWAEEGGAYLSDLEAEAAKLDSQAEDTAAAPAADPYLDALDAEASTSAPVIRQRNKLGRTAIPVGLSRKAFDNELAENFVGTNLLYGKLTDKDKEKVYAKYKEDNSIGSIRKFIARLL